MGKILLKFKNKMKTFALGIGFLVLVSHQNSYAYTEGLITASGEFFPQTDLGSGDFTPFYGFSIKADLMNNTGWDFGLGSTWAANNHQMFDMRGMYWFSNHMTGVYFGIDTHAQYLPKFGIGGGLILGNSLPLTEYISFDVNAEAGYGSSQFYRTAYDPFYYIISAGLSISFM